MKRYNDNLKIKEEKEFSQCTFKPELKSERREYSMFDESESMYERSKKWENEKSAKLQRFRESKASEEFDECTFNPKILGKINKGDRNNNVKSSKTNDETGE